MRRRSICLIKCIIGLSVAFIAVSNCFNVMSNSSTPPMSTPDQAHIAAHNSNRNNEGIHPVISAARDRGDLDSIGSPSLDGLAIKAAALSPFAPAITATKSHTPSGSANPGDTLTYTVVISNSGTSDATGVNFTDTIDPNTTLVPGSVKASPIAVDDSYHTIGNVNISVPAAQGVVANDSNSGFGTLTVTQVNATAVPGTAATANGSVTMNSDGSFTYTPNVAFRGPSDSFTYTLDNGSGSPDTATVTIAVNGLIWFVDTTAAPGGDGRLSTPFNCLAGAGCFDPVAADIANDNIFVYSALYTGGLTLLSGQKLIGQGASQSLPMITGLAAPSGNSLLPSTGGANPTITSTANGVDLGSNNQIWGVTFGNTTGAGISGTGFGTLTVRDTTINGTGQALNLSTGTLDAIFQSISSVSSSSTGITVNAAAGSMSVTGATSVTSLTGVGVNLTNNTGTFTFSALNITNTTQKGLLATDNSNTITTTSGTISSTGAAAVEITRSSGTTPLVISLTSVSANGGTDGVILTNTSGSFSVVGDGSNTRNNSGGTIQNTTNNGVTLSNVQNVSLDHLEIQSTVNSGVKGTLVTNFTYKNSTINNSGTGGGAQTSNIAFNTDSAGTENNVNGTLTITNNALTNAFFHGVSVKNFNGTLSDVNVSNNTITSSTSTATSKGVGIRFNALGGPGGGSTANISKATINLNTITNFPSDSGIQMTGGNAVEGGASCTMGSAGNPIAITNNTISGQSAANRIGTQGILFNVSGTGTGDFNVSGNIVSNTTGNSISHNVFGDAIVTTVIDGNTIVSNNIVGSSGIAGGTSTAAGFTSTPSLTVTISNNTISQTDGNGILFVARDLATGQLNIAIKNNIVAAPLTGFRPGIRVDAGNGAGDNDVCLDMSGNTSAGSGGSLGLGLRKQGTSTTVNAFGVEGMAATASPGVEAYVDGLNPAGGGTLLLSATSGFSNCGTAPMSLPGGGDIAISSVNPITDGEGTNSAGNGQDPLHAARGEAPKDDDVRKLTPQELTSMTHAAIERWRQIGISLEDIARLQAVSFEIADLPTGQIATSDSTRIKVDETAAGYGWYFDPFPLEDSEYQVLVPNRELQTTDLSPAQGKMDLLSVIMRELGTVYLQGKDRVPKSIRKNIQPLMEGTLSPGVRRLPLDQLRVTPQSQTGSIKPSTDERLSAQSSAAQPVAPESSSQPAVEHSEVPSSNEKIPARARYASYNPATDERLATSALMKGRNPGDARNHAPNARRVSALSPFSGETVSLSVGTIPPGESVTIMFQVTVDTPFPNGVCNVTNQGHVTGSNFSQVDTNIDVTPINKAVTIGACPANVTTNTDAGVCTAVVSFTTPTGDGCPSPTVTCSPASGTAFAKGVTTVTCTATNGTPPDATCTFTVTVNDAEAPTITCPASVTQGTDPGVCTAAVTYANATATDNCPGVGTPVCTPASGSTFAKGTTTVSCTVSDASSNSAICSFTVTVNDTTAPSITCPASITQSTDPNLCTAVVTYSNATATDNCPGVGTPVCAPASGSTFSTGVTTVTCTVSDASSNSANCSFTVTVKDTQAPNLSPCPANISVNSSGGCQVVTYPTPTATDNCGSATVVCSPPSGFCFAPGTTTVNCTASDTSPDSPDTSCSFTVTVVPCTITCPSNISVNNTPNLCGAAVTYAPSFGAGCGTVICSPSSGSFFPVGTTTVACTTTAGPACSFTVTVADAQAPTITTCPPNRTLSTNGGSQIALPSITGEVVATDNCTPSGSLVITQSPVAGTMIGLGTTLVTITVKDAANNQSTCVVTITVVKFAAKDFVVFSSEYTKLNANATVNTGNVGANNSLPDPNGPPDDKEEVEIGERVTMLQAGSSVVGDTVRLRADSSVYNVYFNESFFSTSATILGSQVSPLSLPVTTMPAFPTVTPGTTDVVVPANQTVTLAPGSYRNITVNNKGTLKLTGGTYQVSSLDIRQEANIFCLAQTEVRVKIEMDTDAKAFIGPDASVPSLQASQIIFYVEGADGGGGLSPTSVQIGERNTVFANIYAVNGTVVLKANTTATGAFFGRQAQIGERVELTLKSAF